MEKEGKRKGRGKKRKGRGKERKRKGKEEGEKRRNQGKGIEEERKRKNQETKGKPEVPPLGRNNLQKTLENLKFQLLTTFSLIYYQKYCLIEKRIHKWTFFHLYIPKALPN